MAWIKFPTTLLANAQVLLLAQALDVPLPHALWHLLALLSWCMENVTDGHLETRDPRILASAGLWEGDPEVFVQALIRTGWIVPTEKGVQICQWQTYAGPVLKNRQRQARYRQRRKGLTGSGERCGFPSGQPGDDDTHLPVTLPNVTAVTSPNGAAHPPVTLPNVTAVTSPNGTAHPPVTLPNVTADATAPSPLAAMSTAPRQATDQTAFARDHGPHGSHDPVPSQGSGSSSDSSLLHGDPHATPMGDHACRCEKSFSLVRQEESHEAPLGSHGNHEPFPLKDLETRAGENAPTPRLRRGATPLASRKGDIPAWGSTCVGGTHDASTHAAPERPSGSDVVQDRGGHDPVRVGDPEGSGGGVEKADPHGDRARVKAEGEIAGGHGSRRCPEPDDDDADLEALFDPHGPPLAEVVARILARWGRTSAGGDGAAPAGGWGETASSAGGDALPVSPTGLGRQEAAGVAPPGAVEAVPVPAPAAVSPVGSGDRPEVFADPAGEGTTGPVDRSSARWLRPIAGGTDGLPGGPVEGMVGDVSGVVTASAETSGDVRPAERPGAPPPVGETTGEAAPDVEGEKAGPVRPSGAPHVPTAGETTSLGVPGLVLTVWELFGLSVTGGAGAPEEPPAVRTAKTASSRSRAGERTVPRTTKTLRPSARPDTPTVAASGEPGREDGAQARPLPRPDEEARPSARALFAALQAALGHGPATRSERGAWNRAVKDLREAEPPVTPEEIPRLVEAFRRVWPGLTVTPLALAKHLGFLRRAPARGPGVVRGASGSRGVVDPATGLRPEVAQALRIRELFRARERQGGDP